MNEKKQEKNENCFANVETNDHTIKNYPKLDAKEAELDVAKVSPLKIDLQTLCKMKNEHLLPFAISTHLHLNNACLL